MKVGTSSDSACAGATVVRAPPTARAVAPAARRPKRRAVRRMKLVLPLPGNTPCGVITSRSPTRSIATMTERVTPSGGTRAGRARPHRRMLEPFSLAAPRHTCQDRSMAPTAPATDEALAELLAEAKTLQPKTIALRRRLHRRPEQGLQLPGTQAAILHALEGLPLEIHRGTTTSSVTAVLRGNKPGPAVLLRGDMDALPLHEDTGDDFASEIPGTMHACGHDTHVAMLASAARLLSTHTDELAGSVVFMFQPGEEGYSGARYMVDEGVLDAAGERVRTAFGIHVDAGSPSGITAVRAGTLMASADSFTVRLTGRSGHGAMPH